MRNSKPLPGKKPNLQVPVASRVAMAGNRRINYYPGLTLFAVLVITLLAYYPSIKNNFTNWDDTGYVTENQAVIHGNVKDLLGKDKFVMGNYHPLTMITFVWEYEHARLNPARYHIDNLILHLLNTLLVFLLIFLLAGSWQGAAITSALFGVHPMHVESVAWISERKDVLYTFFYLASLVVYTSYARNRKPLAYIACLVLFLLSLFSKGQAVTLPLILLLVDYFCNRKMGMNTYLEKIPFFVLSILFGLIAIIAQSTFTDSVSHYSGIYLNQLFFASYSLLDYVIKLILPFNLSIFYPYPEINNGWLPVQFYIAPFLVILLLFLGYKYYRANKTIVFGALFFLITIAPLLQLLPVGSSMMFDRYSYIPYIGLFFIIGQVFVFFSGYEISAGKITLNRRKGSTKFRTTSLAIILLATGLYAYAGNRQCLVWKDGGSLWRNEIENYPNLSFAYDNLGSFYCQKGDEYLSHNDKELANQFYEKADTFLKAGIPLDHGNNAVSEHIFSELGEVNHQLNRDTESDKYFDKALTMGSKNIHTLNDYAFYLSERNINLEKAAKLSLQSLQIDSTNADCQDTYGWILYKQCKYAEAAAWIKKALGQNPQNPDENEHYGNALYKLGKNENAVVYWQKAKAAGSLSPNLDKEIADKKLYE